jgi:hypothetical protein
MEGLAEAEVTAAHSPRSPISHDDETPSDPAIAVQPKQFRPRRG